MKKITKEEFDELPLRGEPNKVLEELKKLKVGGMVSFTVKEWGRKTPPSSMWGSYKARLGMTIIFRKSGDTHYAKRLA